MAGRQLRDKRVIASIVVVILVVAFVAAVTYQGRFTSQTSDSDNTSVVGTVSTQSTNFTSSVSGGGASQERTTLHFLNPCNCSYDLSWAWSTYNTLSALKSAANVIVVAQVTATHTVGVNVSNFSFGSFATSEGLIPVTGYNITVTTVMSGSPKLVGSALSVAQIGGASNGTTASVAGYPALSVGQSYVFFLSTLGCVLGGTNELSSLYASIDPTAFITTGGPQGLFSIQGGAVYSLDNTYLQADSWLPVKADGVPLAQFVTEVQSAAVHTTTSQSTTSSVSTSGLSTTTLGC